MLKIKFRSVLSVLTVIGINYATDVIAAGITDYSNSETSAHVTSTVIH
jgi:hypothetical protein